jgi:hypothetical protein
VRLTNTADLIYPGAETFYGHGFLVDYQLDYLAARAGWLLEAITFEDFGFAAGTISEAPLLEARRRGNHDVPLREVLPRAKAAHDFKASAEKARAWWLARSKTWSRLQAVAEALRSTSPRRQMNVLDWLRYGETACDGLSREFFSSRLRPLVQALEKTATPDVRTQAHLLIEDTDGYWWRSKQKTGAPSR